MEKLNYKSYTLNLCTDIIEWGKEFYGMPDDGILVGKRKLEDECMGFSQIDDKEIWIFVPNNCDRKEFENTIAHEVGHIIEFGHEINPEQIDENEELHEKKAEHYELFYKITRGLIDCAVRSDNAKQKLTHP